MGKKTFVLDTNILISSPNAIYGFSVNNVVITSTTLQELDNHKNDMGERGYNTREAVRILDSLLEKGDLLKGVDLYTGGRLYLEPDCIEDNLPIGYSLEKGDNRILSAIIGMEKTNKYEKPIVLITNDVSMRINAACCNVKAERYLNETLYDEEEQYKGRDELVLTSHIIEKIYENKEIDFELRNAAENEYFLIKAMDDEQKNALCVYKNNKIVLVDEKNLRGFSGVKGKNLGQKMLMHALLAPASEIPFVIANGPAGTGKTLLAIACALEQTYCPKQEGRMYDQIMITKPNVLNEEYGFLPGDLEEKVSPLVMPFFDNMKIIFGGKERDSETARRQIQHVIDKEIVKIEAIGYMRGRSLSDTYIIVDEAQNLTVHQALEIVSRAGLNTKVVFLGDPDQIDSRFLDKKSNGLVFAAERMKNSPLCAQVTFYQNESVRSPISKEAAKLMTI